MGAGVGHRAEQPAVPLIFLVGCAPTGASDPPVADTGDLDCTLGRDAVWITASDAFGGFRLAPSG